MTWITATMPPTAGVYDVTLQTGHGRNCKRATASAYWPGRRSKRWTLLDMAVEDGLIVAWSARKTLRWSQGVADARIHPL